MAVPPVKLNISEDVMKKLDDLDLIILGELKILSTLLIHPADLKFLLMLLKWNIDMGTLLIRLDKLEKLFLVKRYYGVDKI